MPVLKIACDLCGKRASLDKTVVAELHGEIRRFCCERCAREFMEKHGREHGHG